MLALTVTPTGPTLAHYPTPPMAYLDHWAFMAFAADERLTERLVGALTRSGGTLAVSWLNLGEYATVTDHDQRLQAERFLDRILPALFCLDVEPFRVSGRERSGIMWPHADQGLASLFVTTREPTGQPFSAAGLCEPVTYPRLGTSREVLGEKLRDRLERLRQEHRETPAVRRDMARADRTPATQAATRTLTITRALVATFFPSLRRPITDHDARDVLHAIVPLAFCDAVLLDAALWDAVERVRRSLPDLPMATAFSGRGDDVEHFLTALGRRSA